MHKIYLPVRCKIEVFMYVYAHRNDTFSSDAFTTYTYDRNSLIWQQKSPLVKFSFFGIRETENNREVIL